MEKLGEILISANMITEGQLNEAFVLQKQTGQKVGQVLVNLGYLTEDALLACLARQSGLEFIYLSEYTIAEDVLKLVPLNFVEKLNVLPLEFDAKNNTLKVAVPDPLNMFIIDDLRIATGYKIKPVVALPNEIRDTIRKLYFKEEAQDIDKIIGETEDESQLTMETLEDSKDAVKYAEDAPIVKLTNSIIITAVRSKSSDIHLEPFEKKCRLRYRTDGVAHEETFFPRNIYNSIVARLKIMSKLDITETRKPQDGRIKMLIDNKEVDFRVSVLPLIYGEKIVLRVLDSSALNLDLSKLGFAEKEMKMFQRAMNAPFGLVLITGPTGSGKSTTLYSVLSTVNSPTINILTVEDPVEYLLAGITQINVNAAVGMTFAIALRALMRQAPNIILVGETRDPETANTVIQAALTGHLVFSTLHTNDAPSAVTRLHNMGIDPFLISSTLLLVGAQRLVRKICPNCKESYEVSLDDLRHIGVTDKMVSGSKTVVLYKGKGCPKCSNGYKGRCGIYEVMEINDKIRELILKNSSDIEIRKAAMENGMTSLRSAVLEKMLLGVTTIEEVLRVTLGDEAGG
jgi:type IV pilus assembly protein PilB